MQNCILLPIEAESQDTALRIFSTLNDRGKPLSDADIFKAQFYKYYSDKGEKERPIVIHRAILGSLDRFTAFLLEECKGYLPLWLAPNQINIIPVNNEYHLEYAKEIYKLLSNEGFKVLLDDRNEKLGYKIRESIMKKYPYTLILGQKEVDNKNISFRRSQSEETITLSKEEFIKMLHDEIACKGIK